MIASLESYSNWREGFLKDALGNLGSGILVLNLFFALEKDVNSEFFDEMNKKVGLQIEQELIFENLEESIVILEDKKLELLNDNFIN